MSLEQKLEFLDAKFATLSAVNQTYLLFVFANLALPSTITQLAKMFKDFHAKFTSQWDSSYMRLARKYATETFFLALPSSYEIQQEESWTKNEIGKEVDTIWEQDQTQEWDEKEWVQARVSSELLLVDVAALTSDKILIDTVANLLLQRSVINIHNLPKASKKLIFPEALLTANEILFHCVALKCNITKPTFTRLKTLCKSSEQTTDNFNWDQKEMQLVVNTLHSTCDNQESDLFETLTDHWKSSLANGTITCLSLVFWIFADANQAKPAAPQKQLNKKSNTSPGSFRWTNIGKVSVRDSNLFRDIPTGKGLFAETDFEKGDVITQYCGKLYKKLNSKIKDESYVIGFQINDERSFYVDGERDWTKCTSSEVGQFAQDPIDVRFENSESVSFHRVEVPVKYRDDLGCLKQASGVDAHIFLVATRDIPKGAEIYQSYNYKRQKDYDYFKMTPKTEDTSDIPLGKPYPLQKRKTNSK